MKIFLTIFVYLLIGFAISATLTGIDKAHGYYDDDPTEPTAICLFWGILVPMYLILKTGDTLHSIASDIVCRIIVKFNSKKGLQNERKRTKG